MLKLLLAICARSHSLTVTNTAVVCEASASCSSTIVVELRFSIDASDADVVKTFGVVEAADQRGSPVRLLKPVDIALHKARARVTSKLQFLGRVSQRVTENVTFSTSFCNPDGTPAACEDSPGQCCNCNPGSPAEARSNCAGGAVKSTTHCFRSSKELWDVFEVRSVAPAVEVDIRAELPTSNAPPRAVNATVSIEAPVVAEEQLTVRLKSDARLSPASVALNGTLVVVPTLSSFFPLDSQEPNLVSADDDWLALPPGMVDLGGACDRVGVTSSAFNAQPNFCLLPHTSCLSNQIEELVESDKLASAKLFLLSRFGRAHSITAQSSKVSLHRLLDRSFNLTVTVTFPAASVPLEADDIAGVIESVSSTHATSVDVQVSNPVDVAGRFSVEMSCEHAAVQKPVQQVRIGAQARQVAAFWVFALGSAPVDTSCTATLRTAVGRVVHQSVATVRVAPIASAMQGLASSSL